MYCILHADKAIHTTIHTLHYTYTTTLYIHCTIHTLHTIQYHTIPTLHYTYTTHYSPIYPFLRQTRSSME